MSPQLYTYSVYDAIPESSTFTTSIPSAAATAGTSIPYSNRPRRYSSSPYLSPTPTPSPPSSRIPWSRFQHHHQHSQFNPHSAGGEHISSHPPPPPPPQPSSSHQQQQAQRHSQQLQAPRLRPPACSICSSAHCSNRCEFTSLVIATEDAESATLSPLLDEIRRVVTTRAQREIQREYHSRVGEAWNRIQRSHPSRHHHHHRHHHNSSSSGGGEQERMQLLLQQEADALWRECVQSYPAVLEKEYRHIEAGMRHGRGWRGEEAEIAASTAEPVGSSGGGGRYGASRSSAGGRGPGPGQAGKLRIYTG